MIFSAQLSMGPRRRNQGLFADFAGCHRQLVTLCVRPDFEFFANTQPFDPKKSPRVQSSPPPVPAGARRGIF